MRLSGDQFYGVKLSKVIKAHSDNPDDEMMVRLESRALHH